MKDWLPLANMLRNYAIPMHKLKRGVDAVKRPEGKGRPHQNDPDAGMG